MPVSQKNRPIQVATPLGDDVLLFYRMQGGEKLSELFEYELDMLSEDAAIEPDKLLGQNVSVGVGLPDNQWRYFNGYVARFGQLETLDGFARYRVVLRPWLWFLTRASNCRIFQEMTAPDIVKQVLSIQGFSDVKDKLSGQYPQREYCVQYRETDFDFVSRLLEEEGIYYYFAHENGRHSLVLADSASAHEKFPGYEKIPYHPERGGMDKSRADHVHEWMVARQIQPGAQAMTDYDFTKPKANLLAKSNVSKNHAHSGYECFDYPGRYVEASQGENLARHRMEGCQARHETFDGAGNPRGLSVGYLFALENHPRAAQNREYLIVSADYRLKLDAYIASAAPSTEEDMYQCHFSAMQASVTYRPPLQTPKAVVQGPQTAIITGPAGEEIHTDQYGRVKVQFHWDRYGQRDEKSSCWVRVAQPWAGKNWGMLALPRIGQEVVVEFLEGDPDRPLITGSVYNQSQMPPYALPANANLSAIKSSSTKGGGGFNEIRFDDKKGSEQVFIHAEKNQDVRVKNDAMEWVGNESHQIVQADLLEEVGGNRHSTVKGNHNVEVKGTASHKAGMDWQQKVGAKHAVDAGMEIHLKAGMNIVIEAGMSVTLKAGGGFIVVGPAGVTISGTPVLINSGGSAGSGSGASPEAPKLPKAAADDKGGGKDAPPPPKPPKPVTYGPSAAVLKQAAQDGTALCEKCKAAAPSS